ncbi:MAG: hypothetical protein PWQ37_2698 [Candidatus Petromonas sp.]|jgi:hypothetical protein|nr:hypothetical protein [Candidatus Petromonas sp.]
MKKLTSWILISLMIMNIFTTASFAEDNKLDDAKDTLLQVVKFIRSFKDATEHWANKFIARLYDAGFIKGYPDGSFKPDNPIKVGEFTKILISSLGYDDLKVSDKGHWSLNYINKAKELGIIHEEEFTESDLDRNITRAEMARMIVRSLTEEYPSNLEEYKPLIKDYSSIPSEHKDYVLKAYSKGIITGYPDGTFGYSKNATRAEASTMIVRLLDESERKVPKITNNEIEKNEYVKETLYNDKIVATDAWSKETVTIVPETKESIETYNKIINIIAENTKGNYQIGIHKDYGVGIGVTDENGMLKYEIHIRNKPNGRGDIYESSLKDFDDEKTINDYKEILKIIFPTEYENVFDLMRNLYNTKNHRNYNNSYKADGREYHTNYSELADRVNIFIGEKVK